MFTHGWNVLGQRVMKRAHIGDILNFDLCDLQKYVKLKPWASCHVSLLDTYDKILEMIQPLIQEQ
jgi:hypothetical protein